jgi:para-nitrobenzyl esterase
VLSSRELPWRPEDRKVSELMGSYWSNFARTGDPNGDGLPRWPSYSQDGYQVLHLRADPRAAPDEHRARYQFLDGR